MPDLGKKLAPEPEEVDAPPVEPVEPAFAEEPVEDAAPVAEATGVDADGSEHQEAEEQPESAPTSEDAAEFRVKPWTVDGRKWVLEALEGDQCVERWSFASEAEAMKAMQAKTKG